MFKFAKQFIHTSRLHIPKFTADIEPPLITKLTKLIENTYLLSRLCTVSFDGQKFLPSQQLAEKLNDIAADSLGNTQFLDFKTLRKLIYLISKFGCNDSNLLCCVWDSIHKKLLLGEQVEPLNKNKLNNVRSVDLKRRKLKSIAMLPMGRGSLILPFCASLTHSIHYNEQCIKLANKFIKSTIRSRLYSTLEDASLACFGYTILLNYYKTLELTEMAKLVSMYKEWRFSEATNDEIEAKKKEFDKVYPNLGCFGTYFLTK